MTELVVVVAGFAVLYVILSRFGPAVLTRLEMYKRQLDWEELEYLEGELAKLEAVDQGDELVAEDVRDVGDAAQIRSRLNAEIKRRRQRR